MRTTKELLQIMLDNKKKLDSGLCCLAAQLCDEFIITDEEYNFISDYIEDNKPLIRRSAYWWKPGNKRPRIKWLKEHIELNK